MRPEQTTLRYVLLVGLGVLALASGCAHRVYARPMGVAVYSAPPPPPATRVVVRPSQPYSNAVWVEGHYEWNGNQYVWYPGHYVQGRSGYTFVQPAWQRQGNRYVYVQGGWGQGGQVVHRYAPPARTVVVQPTYRQQQPVYRGGGVVVQGPGRPGVVVRRQPVRRQVVVRPGRPGGVRVVGPRGGTVTVRPQ